MDELTIRKQTAMEIISAGKKIDTPERLAELRMDKSVPHYKDVSPQERVAWLGAQLFGLSLLAHIRVDGDTVIIDATMLDTEIMEDNLLRDLTFVEMQEAFRKGLNGEYGEYFGLTSVSLLMFLNGFLRSEKKMKASAIVRKAREQEQKAKDERFFKALYQAEADGKIKLPDFSRMFVNGNGNGTK